MSAYVVEDALISTIVASLAHLNRPGVYISMPAEFAKLDIGSSSDAAKIGKKLKDMNVRAVCQRYTSDKVTDYEPYKHMSVLPPSLTQLYLALRTYLYQCSEGTVVKSKLYKQMTELKNDVACAYIDNAIERSAQ